MKKLTPLRIILLLVIVFGLYKFASYEYDEHKAKQVYAQMEQIDSQLDALKVTAIQLRAEKESDSELIKSISLLDKTNIVALKSNVITKVNNIGYESNLQQQLLVLVENTNESNFRVNDHNIKVLVKQVQVNYNQRIIDFTSQIKELTEEVQELNNSVSSMSSVKLRDLELARLKFLSNKISETVIDLKGSVLEDVLDDAPESKED